MFGHAAAFLCPHPPLKNSGQPLKIHSPCPQGFPLDLGPELTSGLTSPGTSCRQCVCLSPLAAVRLGTVTHSDTAKPLRPRRGWGCPALRSPGTNTWSSIYAGDSSWSLATVFSFHTGSPAGIECPPPRPLQTVAHKVIKPLPQESVCLVNQPARPKQTVSTLPPEVSRISLSHRATQ